MWEMRRKETLIVSVQSWRRRRRRYMYYRSFFTCFHRKKPVAQFRRIQKHTLTTRRRSLRLFHAMLKKFWKFISSMRFAIALLLILALACAAAPLMCLLMWMCSDLRWSSRQEIFQMVLL